MITIVGFWIANGEKHPHERGKTIMDKRELELFRKEIAKEMKIEPIDVLFKYMEK